jgi:hypothetical protein
MEALFSSGKCEINQDDPDKLMELMKFLEEKRKNVKKVDSDQGFYILGWFQQLALA